MFINIIMSHHKPSNKVLNTIKPDVMFELTNSYIFYSNSIDCFVELDSYRWLASTTH